MTTKVPPAVAEIASQAEAEAGTATDKFMTPQRVSQAITALDPAWTGTDITGLAAVTPATGDSIVISDVDDSGNLKEALLSTLKPVLQAADFTSGNIDINTDGTYISTTAHSLGASPTNVELFMKCTSTEAGYAADDMIKSGPGVGNITGPTLSWDATNIYIAYEGTVFDVADRSTGASARLGETTNVLDNFKWIVKAWK